MQEFGRPMRIDPRTAEGREELAASHGWHTTWCATIAAIQVAINKNESRWRFDPRHALQRELAHARAQLELL